MIQIERQSKILNSDALYAISIFLNQIANDVLLVVETVLIITGIYVFYPPILLRILGDESRAMAELTAQTFWQHSITILFAFLLICKTGKFFYKTYTSTGSLGFLNILSAIIAALIVLGTTFDGDKIILTLFLWFAIKVITQATTDRINIQRNIYANVNKNEEIEHLRLTIQHLKGKDNGDSARE